MPSPRRAGSRRSGTATCSLGTARTVCTAVSVPRRCHWRASAPGGHFGRYVSTDRLGNRRPLRGRFRRSAGESRPFGSGWGGSAGVRHHGGMGTPSYDPAADVVELCRDLIRIDTTNFGDQPGPGERKAAELVATLLDEVGIESELWEAEPGRTNVVARWGGDAGRPAAAARPPRRGARQRRRLARPPVLRRDRGRHGVGPRRGRHEGLRRDAALDGARPRPGRRRARRGRWCSASPPTRRRAAPRGPGRSSTGVPTCSRAAARRSARSAGSARPCGAAGCT